MTHKQVNNLIIRHCKQKHRSIAILNKIISKLYGHAGIDNETVVHALVNFCDEYKLVKDWQRFFLNVNPDKEVWWVGKKKEWREAIIDDLVAVIRYTNVAVFKDDYTPSLSYKLFEAKHYC